MTPEAAMRIALSQARRSSGRTHPNPSVGAVIFRAGRVLGQGRTRPPGGPHAETVAILAAHRRHGARALRGASMAVTLEPCCHVGRTGPCTQAIIEAGLRRVYIGCRDPHERVAQRSVTRLRRAGVEVETGVLEAECRRQNRGFLSVCERGRPFVTLKLATSLDGRIATATGESRWITGPQARRFVHRLRARTDAVMVGSGTARADDPELTARRGGKIIHRPIRVVAASRLALPRDLRLLRDGGETWLLHTRAARGQRALTAGELRRIEVPRSSAGVDLRAAMARLGALGLTTLLVEGGGELSAGLLRDGLVDELHWIQAPVLLGADAKPALGALEVARLEDAQKLGAVELGRLGADIRITALLPDAR